LSAASNGQIKSKLLARASGLFYFPGTLNSHKNLHQNSGSANYL
jgi:hypothetical protein